MHRWLPLWTVMLIRRSWRRFRRSCSWHRRILLPCSKCRRKPSLLLRVTKSGRWTKSLATTTSQCDRTFRRLTLSRALNWARSRWARRKDSSAGERTTFESKRRADRVRRLRDWIKVVWWRRAEQLKSVWLHERVGATLATTQAWWPQPCVTLS